MNEQNNSQPNESIQQNNPQINKSIQISKNIWTIIISIVITAVIVGGSVYAWQKSNLKDKEQTLQQQITSLESQVSLLKQNLDRSTVDSQPTEETNSETNDWNNYSNSKYGYSIKYPKDWFNLPNQGAPDTHKYFSNENVGAPLEIGSDGIFIAIEVNENNNGLSLSEWASKAPGNSKSKISNVKNIVINDILAIQQLEDFTKAEGTESGYSLATYLMKGNTVYSIKGLTFNSTASDKYKEEYNLMVGSFVLTK